jgi:hypothetical protein
MNVEVMRGRILQLAGKIFEFLGRITGSEIQRRHGYQMVIVGQMHILGARATELLRYCDPRQVTSLQPARIRTGVRVP